MMDAKNKKIIEYSVLVAEALGLAIVLYSLTYDNGVEWDEAFTWWIITKQDIPGLLEATAADVHPPLYYLIGKLALWLFGESHHVLAVVSVVPIAGCMFLNGIVTKRRFGVAAAFLLNAFISVCPFFLYHNVSTRMYSWMLFFVFSSILFAYEILCGGGKISWIMFCISGIGAVYTQYFALLPVVFAYFWLGIHFVRQKEWKKTWGLFGIAGISVLSYLPWLKIAIDSLMREEVQQKKKYTMDFSPVHFFEDVFDTNLFQSGYLTFLIFLALVAVWICLRKRFSNLENSFLLMLFGNGIFSLVIAQLIGAINGHFFAYRYVNYVELFVCWIMAIVVTKSNKWLVGLLAVWICVLGYAEYQDVYDYRYNYSPYMEKTEHFIADNISESDILVYDMEFWGGIVYSYYIDHDEWIFFRDVDLSQYKGKTLWFFRYFSPFFTEEEKEKYGLETERFYDLGFKGAVTFALEKVVVKP